MHAYKQYEQYYQRIRIASHWAPHYVMGYGAIGTGFKAWLVWKWLRRSSKFQKKHLEYWMRYRGVSALIGDTFDTKSPLHFLQGVVPDDKPGWYGDKWAETAWFYYDAPLADLDELYKNKRAVLLAKRYGCKVLSGDDKNSTVYRTAVFVDKDRAKKIAREWDDNPTIPKAGQPWSLLATVKATPNFEDEK
jgi:hypothetical protein